MRRWHLHIELLDDLVVSRRSATQGEHGSRDRVPGSALRGWCAAHLYTELGEAAWPVFHAGGVRWLDGLPADRTGHRSTPVPLSWHNDKADATSSPHDGNHWKPDAVFNLAAGSVERPGFQPKGLREGFVGEGGQWLQVQRRRRTMTAIARDGQVAEGQLFSYESLAAGQRFVAALEVDDGVADEAVVQRLLELLHGRMRLGRSRSAQYGRVQSQVEEAAPTLPPRSEVVGDTLHLLLVSDACLRDDHGRPTLAPDAVTLRLPEGVAIDTSRCYLRSRRHGGWNAWRGGPEMERQVLTAGGVITLRATAGFDAALLARLARGIGTERAAGLGEVLLHPAWLRTLKPWFEVSDTSTTLETPPAGLNGASVTAPDTPLLRALNRRAGTSTRQDLLHSVAARSLMNLAACWQALRRHRAVAHDAPIGPGASQWGALSAAAARVTSLDGLREALLGATAGLVSRRQANSEAPRKEFWDEEWPSPTGRMSLARWVGETLDALAAAEGTDAARLDAWQRLCDTVRRVQPHRNEASLQHLKSSPEAA